MLSRIAFVLSILGAVFSVLACQQKKGSQTGGKLEATSLAIQQEIITPRCLQCHSDSTHRAGVVLTDIAQAGTKSPKKVIVPGCPEESLLYQEVKEKAMPPSDSGLPTLTDSEISTVAEWIRSLGPSCKPKN